MIIRLLYLLAGALVGGIAGALASEALRRARTLTVTVWPDLGAPNEGSPLYRGHQPITEQHRTRTGQ